MQFHFIAWIDLSVHCLLIVYSLSVHPPVHPPDYVFLPLRYPHHSTPACPFSQTPRYTSQAQLPTGGILVPKQPSTSPFSQGPLNLTFLCAIQSLFCPAPLLSSSSRASKLELAPKPLNIHARPDEIREIAPLHLPKHAP
jgi:hypothetical protein